MTGGRILIVNADDFGQSPGVNEGVIRAHEEGIVTSASLMVRWPAAEEAAAYAKGRPGLSLGLHLDLGEWAYVDEEWRANYEVVDTEDSDAVAAEVDAQLESFQRLTGRPPTHLDSHQHVHRQQPVRRWMLRAGERLGVPVRSFAPGVSYRGDFYGQDGRGFPVPDAISVESLVRLVERLPEGVSELGCHPGYAGDLRTMYRDERQVEVETLCDARVRSAIAASGVRLRSFAGLG